MALLFTKAERTKLTRNADTQDPMCKPVVKLFNPTGNGTWLISELHEDGTAFGLADLGMGSPEMGYIDMKELAAFRGRAGLPIERDRWFSPTKSLVAYADDAAAAGRLTV